MTIFKTTPSELYELEMTYVVIPSESIALYESVEAAAIHVYLLDKPEDWVIRDTDIINRFKGLGTRRFRSAIRELKRIGLLVSYSIIDDESGQFTGRQRDLFAHPDLVPVSHDSHSTVTTVSHNSHSTGVNTGFQGDSAKDSTVSDIIHVADYPTDGKSTGRITPQDGYRDHLHITDSLHTKDLLNITEDTHGTANADAAPGDKFLDSGDSEEKPPSEEKTFYDQGRFVERCIREGITPSLEDLKYLNSRNWVVNGERLTLDAYIQERKA